MPPSSLFADLTAIATLKKGKSTSSTLTTPNLHTFTNHLLHLCIVPVQPATSQTCQPLQNNHIITKHKLTALLSLHSNVTHLTKLILTPWSAWLNSNNSYPSKTLFLGHQNVLPYHSESAAPVVSLLTATPSFSTSTSHPYQRAPFFTYVLSFINMLQVYAINMKRDQPRIG